MSDAGLIRHNDDTRAFQRTDDIGLDRSAPTAEPENGREHRAFQSRNPSRSDAALFDAWYFQ
jgi:hypothetical protein